MTKVSINPGICGLITNVEVEADEDGMEIKLKVDSLCQAVKTLMEEWGEEFESFDLCLKRPGSGPLYEYASTHFPAHCSCTTIAGIIKAVEVECNLALPKDTSIKFL